MLLHRFDAKLPVPLVPSSTPPERLLVFPLCHRKALTSPTPVVHMGREGHELDTLRASTPMHEIDTRQARGVLDHPVVLCRHIFESACISTTPWTGALRMASRRL